MNNEQRIAEIDKINIEIGKISPDWVFLDLKIKTKTFTDSNDEIATHKSWNELDNQLHDLHKKRRSLQTEYYVDFFNDQDILVTALILLNRKVEINTHKNGWNESMKNPEMRELLFDIHKQLLNTTRKPGINNIISN